MPKPGKEQIQEIFKQTLSSISISKKIQWNKFIESMMGVSSATVVKIANDAAKLAVLSGEKIINEEHLQTAFQENLILIKK